MLTARRTAADSPGAGAGGAGAPLQTSTTANSYISLGAFETMGDDVGRMATGLSYLSETTKLQIAEYEGEVDPRKRSRKALGLAQSLMQVARQHHQQQDAPEAVGYYRQSLGLIEEFIAAREGEDTAPAKKAVNYARFVLSEVCSSLGVAYNDVGHQDEALEMHQRALSLRKDVAGKEHVSVAECLNNLGAVYYGRNALQKAVENYEEALELLVQASGGREEGAYVALTLYNIGLCRGGLGQGHAAVAALKKALDLAERALGADHRQVELIRETMDQAMSGKEPPKGTPGADGDAAGGDAEAKASGEPKGPAA